MIMLKLECTIFIWCETGKPLDRYTRDNTYTTHLRFKRVFQQYKLLEHTACNDATVKSLQNYDITLFWDHVKVANKSVIPFRTNVYGGGGWFVFGSY